MTKRKQIIHHELIRLTNTLRDKFTTDLTKVLGFDANTIGHNLGIARNSVSKELNQLTSDGLVLKIKSRPVYFLDKKSYEELIQRQLTVNVYDESTQYQLLPKVAEPIIDPFSQLIGYDRSLKTAVEKGRAAVLYPDGLHVLLTGDSGVGKTYFAELMHQLREQQNKQPVPFIYFNCAEYYNNQELLSSHLFGHKQGAFTGASYNKVGLIEQANGGLLLLDEVHRLSNESQEKLFLIIDKGEFHPLGSSDKPIKVNIRLICATTENIQSSLLRTFLRRIQVYITLPSIEQRSLEERAELIFHFILLESRKIKRTIAIDKIALIYLLSKPLKGNIGQLKSDIQFLCAQGWAADLNQLSSTLLLDKRFIEEPCAPTPEVTTLINALFKNDAQIEISTTDKLQLKNTLSLLSAKEDSDLFYTFITQEYVNLRNSHVSPQETLSILKKKLRNIFDYGINQKNSGHSQYLHSEQLEKRISSLTEYIEEILGFVLQDHLKSLLHKHFLTLLAYIQKGLIPNLYSSNLILDHCKDEYENAVLVCKRIEAIFYIQCPSTEIVYWCLFLKECRLNRLKKSAPDNYKVIFIAHGDTTATSMANYVNRILEYQLITPINMPFEQSVHDTLAILIEKIKQYECQQLILIVDTGSLVHFGNVIHQLFNINVLLLHNITLSALLDFSLDITYAAKDFAEIINLIQDKNIDYKLCDQVDEDHEQVLMISCITGMGTAVKIKNVIEESFKELLINTRILIVDYNDIRSPERLRNILNTQERVVGIIGTFQPELPDIPFISLEELFSEQGPELVISLLKPHMSENERRLIIEKSTMKFIGALTLESIINQISVLNPQRILREMEDLYQYICQKLDLHPSKQVTLRFLIHCCCMVERIVISRKPLQMAIDNQTIHSNYAISVIKEAFLPIEKSYTIRLSDAEFLYIYELLYS